MLANKIVLNNQIYDAFTVYIVGIAVVLGKCSVCFDVMPSGMWNVFSRQQEGTQERITSS